MRYISRLSGKAISFKTKGAYDAYLADLKKTGVMLPDVGVNRRRKGLVRRAERQEAKYLSTDPYHLRNNPHEVVSPPPGHVPQTFSLIHPTRGRPAPAWECMNLWKDRMSSHNKLEYIISLDRDDADKYQPILKHQQDFPLKVVTWDNPTMVAALNRGAKFATGDVLIYVSDDFECPDNWDLKIQSAVGSKIDWVLFVRDGLQEETQTISILSRKYYEHFGYMYYPEYISMWADPDFTQTAIRMGKVIDGKHLTFKHNHYSVGKAPNDETYQRQNSSKAWVHGETLFNKRKAENFGI